MKRSLKKLLDFTLYTQDDQKGNIKDFLFDEDRWIIRYMEADQGKILPSKKVLIPRVFLGETDWENEKFHIELKKEELDNSPTIDDKMPVSRAYEEKLANHLKVEHYWGIAPPVTGYPGYPPRPIEIPHNQIKEDDIDTNLRSFSEILGYEIYTTDGAYGKVQDIIIDDEDWQVLYFISDSEFTDTTKQIMIGINWIDKISYKDQQITLEVTNDTIAIAPEFKPAQPINITYEKKVQDFYGRVLKKWKEEV